MPGDECINPEESGGAGYMKAKASTASKRRSCCPSAIKCPAILTGIGCCFALLGLVPFLITMATHKNSATLIGLGFMGFGALLLIPGLCWCAVVYAQVQFQVCRFYVGCRHKLVLCFRFLYLDCIMFIAPRLSTLEERSLQTPLPRGDSSVEVSLQSKILQ